MRDICRERKHDLTGDTEGLSGVIPGSPKLLAGDAKTFSVRNGRMNIIEESIIKHNHLFIYNIRDNSF